MQALTPGFFSTLIVVVIIVGLALAAVRLYADFTRPLPRERPPMNRPPRSPTPPQGESGEEYGGE